MHLHCIQDFDVAVKQLVVSMTTNVKNRRKSSKILENIYILIWKNHFEILKNDQRLMLSRPRSRLKSISILTVIFVVIKKSYMIKNRNWANAVFRFDCGTAILHRWIKVWEKYTLKSTLWKNAGSFEVKLFQDEHSYTTRVGPESSHPQDRWSLSLFFRNWWTPTVAVQRKNHSFETPSAAP